jgi:hypothetical protein
MWSVIGTLQLGGDDEELASCFLSLPTSYLSAGVHISCWPHACRSCFIRHHLIRNSSQGDGNNFAIFWGPKAIQVIHSD